MTKTTLSTALLALVLIALAGLTSCGATTKKIWVEDELDARTERALWDVLRLSLDAGDYLVGEGARPGERSIESAWKVDLHPFKNQGWRKKAHLEYSPALTAEGTPVQGRWTVRTRVEMEINASFRGADPRYAEWKPADDDEAAARFILQTARAFLGGGQFEVGAP